MRIIDVSLAALLAGATLVGTAFAQTLPPPAGPTSSAPVTAQPAPSDQAVPGRRRGGDGALAACRADMQTLCNGTAAGKGARVQCLVDNRAKASPECQAAITAVEAKRQGQAAGEIGKTRPGKALAACQGDVAKLCGGSLDKPGKCLRQNTAKLSADCSAALQAMTAVADKVKASCQGDLASLCGGETKRGAAMQCLKVNQAKLSRECGAVVAELPTRVKRVTVQ